MRLREQAAHLRGSTYVTLDPFDALLVYSPVLNGHVSMNHGSERRESSLIARGFSLQRKSLIRAGSTGPLVRLGKELHPAAFRHIGQVCPGAQLPSRGVFPSFEKSDQGQSASAFHQP